MKSFFIGYFIVGFIYACIVTYREYTLGKARPDMYGKNTFLGLLNVFVWNMIIWPICLVCG